MIKNFLLIFSLLLTTTLANAQVTGTKTIGVDYPTLAAAVTALNTTGVGAGGATINVPSGYNETAPSGGFVLGSTLLNASLSAANTLVIQKSGAGANPILTAFTGGSSTTSDGVFKMQGTDYVTIDGIEIKENTANTGAALMEWGIALVNLNAAAPFDGCNNNTIKNCKVTLDKTNPNGAFGIYSAHNIATNNTALTLTAVGDLNSNNKYYTNSISNVNEGIWVLGFAAASPYTLYDQNNDIGGTSAATGNTITNMGVTALFNSFCIYLTNQNASNASYNIIDNGLGGAISSTQLIGIYTTGTSSSFTANNNNVKLTQASGTTIVAGIYNANTGNLTVTNNTIGFNDAAGSGTHYGIFSATATTFNSTITNNTLSSNNTGPTTSATYFIYNSSTVSLANINNNFISNSVINSTSTIAGVYNASSPTTYNVNNNTITNINLQGTGGTFYGAYTGSPATGTFNGNLVDNVSFTNVASTGSIYGIYDISSGVTMNYINNIIRNISTPTTGSLFGIREFGVSGAKTMQNNQIYNFSTSPGGVGGCSITGLSLATGTTDDISNNLVYNLRSTGTTGGTGGTIVGIIVSSGTTNNVYKNKIYDLSTNSTGGLVYGLQFSGGTTNNVYNNLIGNLFTPATTNANGTIGLNISGSTTTNAYYNTVNISGTSTGVGFGSSAVSVSSTPTVTLRNNIFNNATIPTGTGIAVAHRRSTTTLTTYGATSNNNLFFVGGGCASRLIFYDGTNSDQTLAPYKTRVTPRDAASISEDPPFASTTGAATSFLHISTTVPTQIESGGASIATFTDDYDGDVRGATPDIGADEFTGTVATACAGTPVAGTATAANPSLCNGGNTNICLAGNTIASGISIQWQIGTTAVGPWVNVPCATGGTGTCYNTGNLTAGFYYYQAVITCANGGLTSTSNVVTVTVNALPTVTLTSSNPSVVCQNTPVTLTATGGATYSWTPATGLNTTSGPVVIATPTSNTTYTVNVTNAAGCSSSSTISVLVNPAPAITATATPVSICLGNTSQLQVNSTFPTALVNTYAFSAGTGSTLNAMTGSTTVLTTSNDDTPTATPASIGFNFTFNGVSYNQYSVSPDGWILLGGATAVSEFTNVTTSTTNVPRIFPYWDDLATGTDGSVKTLVTGTAPNRIFIVQWNVTVPRNTTGAATATFQAWLYETTNVIEYRYGTMGTPTSGTISAGLTASASNYQSITFSSNSASTTTPNDVNSIAPASGTIYTFTPQTLTYLWSPSATLSNNTIPNPVATPTTTGVTTYTVTATMVPTGCTATATTTVTVNTPTVSGVLVQPTTCVSTNGAITLTVTGTPGTFTYAWTGSGVNATSQNQTGLTVGSYTVTVTHVPSGCTSTSTFILTGPGGCSVCPTIPNVTPTANGCVNTPLTFTNNGLVNMGVTYGIQYKFSSTTLSDPYVGGTTITTVPNSGLTNSGTTATASNSFGAPGTYYVYAILSPTPIDIACRPFSLTTVTVNAVPTVNTVSNQILCNGASTAAITFSGSVTGTTYNWTNNNTTIGLAASGAGNIPSFVATNSTGLVQTASITVTPVSNGCFGTPTTATITVNPTPNVVATPASQVSCSGQTANLTLTGNVTTALYSWTRDNNTAVTGLAASGTGSISSILTNSTNAPVTVTFTITPSANGCTGTPITATITVNPTPTATVAPTTQTICSGANITAIVPSANLTGTVLNWVRNNTATVTGIAASGVGNISGALTNTTTAPITVTFTITPTLNGCSGTPVTSSVLVNPTPVVTLGIFADICKDANAFALIGGAPAGGVYTVDGVAQTIFNPANYTPGNHTIVYTVTNTFGCVSNATQIINVLPQPNKPNAVPNFNSYMQSSVVSNSYVWYLNNNTIDNSNNPIYTATTAGYYQVQVISTDGCKNKSDSLFFIPDVNHTDFLDRQYVYIYPNPITKNSNINIHFNLPTNNTVSYGLFTEIGELLQSGTIPAGSRSFKLDVSKYVNSNYVLRLTDSDKKVTIRRIQVAH